MDNSNEPDLERAPAALRSFAHGVGIIAGTLAVAPLLGALTLAAWVGIAAAWSGSRLCGMISAECSAWTRRNERRRARMRRADEGGDR